MAGWLATYWRLDMGNREDRALYVYVSKQLDSALITQQPAIVLTVFREIYNRLKMHRALRGRAYADDVVDDWIAALYLCCTHVARYRSGL